MEIGKGYIMVKIDKEAQREKRERLPNGLFISPAYAFMLYNLQYGEIMQIGSIAQKLYPEAEPGDIALFHHGVEEGEENLLKEVKRMVVTNGGQTEFQVIEEHRYIAADATMIYGVIKPSGELIPADDYVFVNPMVTVYKKKVTSELLQIIEEEVWDDPELIKWKIEEIKQHIEMLKTSYSSITSLETGKEVDKLDEINNQIESYQKQQQALSQQLHKEVLALATITHINQRTSDELCGSLPGDQVIVSQNILYALQVGDTKMLLLNKEGMYLNTTIGNTVVSK